MIRVLAAFLALLALACSGARSAVPPAVILITCDTLRADRLGAYGYPRDVSPNLDAFAREAVVFERAYATAPHTNPALSSLFTSRMPDEIGVAGGNRTLMPPEIVTLAELLRANGIETAAVVSNWALRRAATELGDAGLAQGFDHYDDRMGSSDGLRPGHFERLADQTTDDAIAWLEGRRGSDTPFFLWVHYQDPHGPYAPPEEIAALFKDSPPEGKRLRFGRSHSGRGQIPAYQIIPGENRSQVYLNRYDGEIRFFDREVGRLLDWLRREGLYQESLILFTADHGESLGEHDYWFSHEEHVFHEAVHVPLMVRFPAGTPHPPGSALVGHLDVLPTVLEFFGLPAAPVRGTSLATEELPADRIVAHTLAPVGAPHRWEGVSDGRYRLILHRGRAMLFDVEEDPGETRDLAEVEPARVRALWERYREFLQAAPADPAVEGVDLPLDDATRRALEAMGYLEAEQEGRPE
jgi:arylsulfatase